MTKTVVVTGVTRGIGREIAVFLAKNGYNVAGIFKSSAEAARALEESCPNIKTYQCDISNNNACAKTIDAIFDCFSEVYGVVNNAGIARAGLFCDTTDETYNRVMDTNLRGTFNITRAFLPSMIRSKCGKIVNISSVWGVSGASTEVVYSASKAGVIGLTKALAKEVGPSGIQVNAVAPGVIDTDMCGTLTKADKAALAEQTALCRIGTAKDVAGSVGFLLSEAADYITGQVLCVDGGMII